MLAFAASAQGAPHKVFLDARPAIASGGGQTVVAWTANGVVQTASRRFDGSFTPGAAVGRAIGSHSPLLAITPAGEQEVVWQSGRTLRSAVRAAGQDAWKLQTIAGVDRLPDPHLVMDPGGRTVLAWLDPAGGPGNRVSLWTSSRLPGGSWSAPSRVAGTSVAGSISAAVDDAGDIVIVYLSRPDAASTGLVEAVTLPSGTTAWSAPAGISQTDLVNNTFVQIAGGGARTFVASWFTANPAGGDVLPRVLSRAARLRLPGGWEAPRTLLPGVNTTAPLYPNLGVHGVDASGNALAILRFSNGGLSAALAATRLSASAGEWTAPAVLDVPPGRDTASPAAFSFLRDGSVTAAYFRIALSGNTMRLASAEAGSNAWLGGDADVAGIPSCRQSPNPWNDVNCPIWSETPPVVLATGPLTTVALQQVDAGMVVLTRAGPGAAWSGPMTLVPVGRTRAILRAGRSRPGTVQVVATCTLPPCRGVAVLRMRDGKQRILGRVPFTLERAGSATGRILLPSGLRHRLTNYAKLWTRLSFSVHEGDGTSEQTRLSFRLSGRVWIGVTNGG